MAEIGIFWVYKGTVIGKSIPIAKGIEGIKGLVDSPDSHIDFWENNLEITKKFPELSSYEYQEIPRGRVLYIKNSGASLIYIDKVLINTESKKLISDYFGFNAANATWKKDNHYTICADDIDKLFNE